MCISPRFAPLGRRFKLVIGIAVLRRLAGAMRPDELARRRVANLANLDETLENPGVALSWPLGQLRKKLAFSSGPDTLGVLNHLAALAAHDWREDDSN